MGSAQIEIIILACLTAAACALPGVFLVLRKVSLMSDAISHSILFGIVIAFFYTQNLSSPLLIVAATLTGILTVTLTEGIIRTKKLKEDAAIGLVFPVLFSIGVILINKYTSDVHIDADCVLFGEIAFAPFNRIVINDIDYGPQGMWVMGAIFILNLLFIAVFYKELKLATFDPDLAAALGFVPVVIHYMLMTLVSITAVGAFEHVGSILVVALMITPPAAAYLLTDRLSHMIIISAGIGILSAIFGYWTAHFLDANIAGSMATMSGVIFALVFVFAPEKGLLAKLWIKRFRKWDFATQMLAVHLFQAEVGHAAETERIVSHMNDHMLWSDDFTSEVIAQGIQDGLIQKQGNKLLLTAFGREKAKIAVSKN